MRASDTGSDAMIPDFFLIGGQKCGTTSLAHYLGSHPDICFSRPKEPNLLTFYYESEGVEGYRKAFAHHSGERLLGEGSVTYTMAPVHSGVPERIASLNPDARLIYLVRDPVERIRSMYRFRVDRGIETALDIDLAVKQDPSYLDFSRYGFQLSLYQSFFSLDRILILYTGDLGLHRRTTLSRAYEFLGVAPDFEPPTIRKKLNQSADARRVRRFLQGPRAVWRNARAVSGRIPRPLRKGLKRLASRPLEAQTANLSPETVEWLQEPLRRDADLFREVTGLEPPWPASLAGGVPDV